jgi:O-antigen ligase
MSSRALPAPAVQTLTGAALGCCAALVALAPDATSKLVLVIALSALPAAVWLLSCPVRWIGVFFVAAWLLPPLPIEMGNSGPHAAILVAAVGLLAGVVRLQGWKVRPDWLSGTILAFFLSCFASLALAALYSGLSVALASLARVCLLGISVYLFLYVRDGPGVLSDAQITRMLRLLFSAAALSAVLACIDFRFQLPAPAGYGAQFVWLETGVFRRAQGVFYEASTLGNLCAFFLAFIAVAMLPPTLRLLPRWTMLLAGVPLAVALVLSYSRASVLNLCTALLVLGWLERKRIRWSRLVIAIAAVAAFGTVILNWIFPRFFTIWLLRIRASFDYFAEAPNAVLSGRLDTWRQLLEHLAENPLHLLFGTGYKTLPYSDLLGRATIADNTWISVLVETGVIGLAALIGLNAAILITSFRVARSDDRVRSFIGLWMFCFWAGQMVQMFSADLLTYWRVLPVYFFMLAIAAQRERNPAVR